tara:strand:+ start:7190 stop:8170 length:981 start_codon:yes stop_codon:yes gene_type:complete
MKRALVTGADGFIGSHLTELLLKQGYKVKALSQYNSFNNWGWLENIKVNKNLKIISGDIRDPQFCETITKDVDVVFHLAALIGIPFSYVSVDHYVETNIKGTLNICYAVKKNNISTMVHTSTSEVYGSAKYVPIDELHPLQPQSPYSATKISADAMVMSLFNSINLPVVIARPFNCYGPRQSSRAIIPAIISQIVNGNKKINIGNVKPTRDFTYVTDTCEAILKLSKNKKSLGQVVNIGSNTEISILNIVKKIKKIMYSDAKLVLERERLRPKKSEVNRLICNNKKLKKLINFKPKVNFDDGLKSTINWFKRSNNRKFYKSEIYNI